MNSTNRALNRIFILTTGLLLTLSGITAVALATVPTVVAQWKRAATTLASGAQPWVSDPIVGKASWLVLGVALLCLALVLLLVAFIVKQGRGRTDVALHHREGTTSLRVDLAVPQALLVEHLQTRPELASVRVSAYEVRRTPMLKVTVRCRRGVSPAAAADVTAGAINDLRQIIGTELPTFTQITGGFRAGSRSRPQVA